MPWMQTMKSILPDFLKEQNVCYPLVSSSRFQKFTLSDLKPQ